MSGEHDFRNFCKIDPSVLHFRRRILSFDLAPAEGFPGADGDSPAAMWAMTIKGTAFLYHQVRCMAAVLFLVGQGLEAPDIVDALLQAARAAKVRSVAPAHGGCTPVAAAGCTPAPS